MLVKGLEPDADFLHDAVTYQWDDKQDMATFTFGRPLVQELEVGRHYTPLPYHTTRGVSLKSTRADIIKAYGKPMAVSIPQVGGARLIYDAVGIAVTVVESTGWVASIAIFNPRSARQIWKF
jgi:hypothetical protein